MSDKVGDATKHIDIMFGKGSLICHNSLPESGTDTSRVGALNLLQNPLVLRYTLQGFILRHDCCVSALTEATAEGLHVSVSSSLWGTHHSCDDFSVGTLFSQILHVNGRYIRRALPQHSVGDKETTSVPLLAVVSIVQ